MTTAASEGKDQLSNVKQVTEGSCHMCFAANEETAVFYNPVQVQNRDLSVLMISLYAERRRAVELARIETKEAKKRAAAAASKKATESSDAVVDTAAEAKADTADIKEEKTAPAEEDTTAAAAAAAAGATPHVDIELHVLDALAASGLRSMRYWKECPDIKHVTINDLDPAAYERAVQNIDSNGLSNDLIAPDIVAGRPRGIRIQTGDATQVMYNSRQSNRKRPHEPRNPGTQLTPDQEAMQQWDVIDLDPYGSAAPFLDAAVQAVTHGGMLNVTCTDMAALGDRTRKPALAGTGACPLRGPGTCRNWPCAFCCTRSPPPPPATAAPFDPFSRWAWTFTCGSLWKSATTRPGSTAFRCRLVMCTSRRSVRPFMQCLRDSWEARKETSTNRPDCQQVSARRQDARSKSLGRCGWDPCTIATS